MKTVLFDRAFLQKRNITPYQVTKDLGLSSTSILYGVLDGKRAPSLALTRSLSHYFSLDQGSLVFPSEVSR